METVEKSEPARGRVGANVDSNPSGGEPSTGRFISTRPAPSSFLHEHPSRQSLCRPTFSPSSARGIKFGREAVSNILCSDSPTLSLLLRPSHSVSLSLSLSLSPSHVHGSCVYARVYAACHLFRSSVRRERMASRRSLRVKSWPIERSGGCDPDSSTVKWVRRIRPAEGGNSGI